MHSAKAALHSAKPLPSATLGKEPPSNPFPVKAALPSVKFRALGKGFAECRAGTWQRFDGIGRRPTLYIFFFKKLFAECHSSGTRQRNLFFKPLCRVPQHRHSAKGVIYLFFKIFFAECDDHCTRKACFLFFLIFFVECNGHCTRQSHL